MSSPSSGPRRSRWLVLGLLAAAGALGTAWWAPRLAADSSLAASSLLDPQTRLAFDDFQRVFGADEVLLVTLRDEGERPLFAPQSLAVLRRLSAHLSTQDGVADVVSMVSLEDFSVVSILGNQAPTPPRPLIPLDGEVSVAAERKLRADPFLATGILSEDGHSTALWVLLDPKLRDRTDYLERVRQIDAAIPRRFDHAPEISVAVTGFPLLRGELRKVFLAHGLWVGALAILGVALVALLFRVPVAAVAAWCLSWPILSGLLVGILHVSERRLHLFSPNLLPLLIVTGGALLLHLGTRRGAARSTLRSVWRICFLSALTASIGFLCLTGSELPALGAFAIEAALGALLAFGVASACLWFAPAALRAPRPRRLLPRVNPRLTPVLGAGLLLLALPWFLLDPGRLGSVGDLVGYLPEDHPRARETRVARKAMQALLGVEIILRLPVDGDQPRVLDEDFLLGIEAFETAVKEAAGETLPRLFGAGALMKYLNTRMQRAGAEGMVDHWKISPETVRFARRFLLQPYLALARAKDKGELVRALEERLGQLLSADGRRLRWHGRLSEPSPAVILDLERRLKPVLAREAERLGAESAYLTGSSIAFAKTTEAVRSTQLQALTQGAIGLGLFLVIALWSLRLGALAAVASAAAVVATINLLWVLRADLNLYTTVLTATVLGVIVDDTMHLLGTWRRRGGSPRYRAAAVLARTGPPIVATSMGMVVAFGAFAASPLPLYRQFAATGISAVLLALAFDLLVVVPFLARRRS